MCYLRTLLTLTLITLLSACGHAPIKEQSPNAFDPTLLSGEWWQQSQLDNNDQLWSRQRPTTPRRFSAKMNFQLPNTFGTTVLHPTDRHYPAVGTFNVQGNIVSTEYRLSSSQFELPARRNRLVQQRFVVLKINNNDMVLRSVPTATTTTANAIDKSRLLGAWRAGEKTFDSNNSSHYLLTPCVQQSSANPCHLVLQADGSAKIRKNVPQQLTVVPSNEPQKFSVQPGTWTLEAHNRLVLKTNQHSQSAAVFELSPAGAGYDGRVNYSTLYW